MHFLDDPQSQELLRALCKEHDVPYDLARQLLTEARNFDKFAFGANQTLTERVANLIEQSVRSGRHSYQEEPSQQ